MASYVHCGACGRAYDAATASRCPACRPLGAEARVAAALEEIATALGDAAPDESVRLRALLGAAPVFSLVRVTPPPAPPPSPPPVWRAMVSGVVGRAARPVRRFARAVLANL